MDLSYIIFGIAKQNMDDFKELYDLTHRQVYAFILTSVKDKVLAREIFIETYKRFWTKASSYDTEYNSEFWLYSIVNNLCVNALKDRSLNISSKSNRIDGFSKIITNALFMLKADRGQILVLRAMTNLNSNDIAKLLWYYKSAEKKEYKKALTELEALSKSYKRSKLISILKDEINELNPDFWDAIESNKSTIIDNISDEEQQDEQLESDNDSLIENEEGNNAVKTTFITRFKRIPLRTLIIIFVVFAIAITIPATIIYNKTKTNNPKPNVNVQFGAKIAIVEIGDKAFYQNYKNQGKLFCYDFKAKTNKPVCDDKIKELITDGQFLFYRNENDGKLYRINPDGSGRLQITQNPGTSMALDGDNLYYSEKDGIYRIKKDGSDRQVVLIPENEEMYRYDMEIYEGKLYFSSGVGGGIFYINLSDPNARAKAIYTSEAYNFQIYEGSLYFSIKTDESNLYYINLKDEKLKKVPDTLLKTQAFYIYNNKIFFDGFPQDSSMSATASSSYIYSVNLDGTNIEKCFSDSASDILVTEKRIYCYYPSDNGKSGKLKVYTNGSYSKPPQIIFG